MAHRAPWSGVTLGYFRILLVSKLGNAVNQIHIREATAADLPALLAFEQGIVKSERPFNNKIKDRSVHYYDIAKLLASDESLVLVAEDEDQLVGTGLAILRTSLVYYQHDRHAYLGLMFVEPSHRGQGVIQQVMERLLSWARAEGISDFYLDVYAENEPAVRAYEKFGFKGNLLEMKLSD
jgi:GNAT superfamily N-acetyltransferase